jgi:hypothetical protein
MNAGSFSSGAATLTGMPVDEHHKTRCSARLSQLNATTLMEMPVDEHHRTKCSVHCELNGTTQC